MTRDWAGWGRGVHHSRCRGPLLCALWWWREGQVHTTSFGRADGARNPCHLSAHHTHMYTCTHVYMQADTCRYTCTCMYTVYSRARAPFLPAPGPQAGAAGAQGAARCRAGPPDPGAGAEGGRGAGRGGRGGGGGVRGVRGSRAGMACARRGRGTPRGRVCVVGLQVSRPLCSCMCARTRAQVCAGLVFGCSLPALACARGGDAGRVGCYGSTHACTLLAGGLHKRTQPRVPLMHAGHGRRRAPRGV